MLRRGMVRRPGLGQTGRRMRAAGAESSPTRIRGPALRRALIAGARRVVAEREQLNRINVFPVPDGDTGSNMAFTLGSVLTPASTPDWVTITR